MKIEESNEIPIERGCGRRDSNGVYITSRLAAVGTPWWAYLMDPPVPIDRAIEAALGLTDRGVKLIKRADCDVYDVWDIVGQGSSPDPCKGHGYFNVADYAVEVSVAGASRKIASKLPLHLLDPQHSKLVLLHRRACLLNAQDYFDHIDQGHWRPPDWRCPRHLPEHMDAQACPEMCAGLWWHDTEGGEQVTEDVQWHNLHGGLSANPQHFPHLKPVVRHMPAFEYAGWARPTVIEPNHQLGVFMVLPISGLDVIKGDRQDEVLEAIRTCPFDVRLCVA